MFPYTLYSDSYSVVYVYSDINVSYIVAALLFHVLPKVIIRAKWYENIVSFCK